MGLRKYSPILAMSLLKNRVSSTSYQISLLIKENQIMLSEKTAGYHVPCVYNYKTICLGQKTGNVQLL